MRYFKNIRKTLLLIETIESEYLKKKYSLLTINEIRVMETMEECNYEINEIAERLKISKGTASSHISKLMKKEIISTECVFADKRKKKVCLTNLGNEILDYMRELNTRIEELMQNEIRHDNQVLLDNINGRISAVLKREFLNDRPNVLSDFSVGDKIKIAKVLGDKEIKEYYWKRSVRKNKNFKILEKNEEGIILEGDEEVFIEKEDEEKLIVIIA